MLNKIIRISVDDYRFISIVSNDNIDIFIETSPTSGGRRRIFYALKSNGRPYFQNNENKEETSIYIIDEIDTDLIGEEMN